MNNNNTTSTTLTKEIFNSEGNTLNYAINQSLLDINTVQICKVISYNSGNRTCVVQSILNNINAKGFPLTPAIQYTVPIMDIAGNNCGIQIEYATGDLVMVGYSQRDITTIKLWFTQTPSSPITKSLNPNSYRKFNISDGIIIGRISSTAPTTVIKITSSGIDLEAGSTPITLNTSGNVNINGNNITLTGSNINLNGTVKINGTNFATHAHSGVQSGGSNTGPVV